MWIWFRLYNKVCLVLKKIWQLQLQVSNICHINNMFRTRSLSLMYCVNLAEFTHISLLLMRVLKIKLYEIDVSRCIIYDFFSIINEIILLVYGNILPIVTMHMTTDWPFAIWPIASFLSNIVDHTLPTKWTTTSVWYISLGLHLVVLDKY